MIKLLNVTVGHNVTNYISRNLSVEYCTERLAYPIADFFGFVSWPFEAIESRDQDVLLLFF